jgi:hypothetical protein
MGSRLLEEDLIPELKVVTVAACMAPCNHSPLFTQTLVANKVGEVAGEKFDRLNNALG